MTENKFNDLFEDLADDREFQLAMLEEGLLHRVALRTLQFRKGLGLSQADLARRLETKQPAVARIEAGEANVTLRTLAQLAFALERFPEDFVTERSVYRGSEYWGPPKLTVIKGGLARGASATGASRFEVEALPRKAV